MPNAKTLIYVALITSIVLNVLLWLHPKTIDKPVEVIKIETRWKVIKEPFMRPSGEAEAILRRIEKATPTLTLAPIVLSKAAGGGWQAPASIKGTLALDYLHYTLTTELKTTSEKENILGLRMALVIFGESGRIWPDVVLMVPLAFGFNAGAGLYEINFTHSWHLWSNCQYNFGLAYTYNQNLAPVLGLSFEI